MGNGHFHAASGGHFTQLRPDLALVAFHNFRAAVSDDCLRDSLFRTPSQLRANRRMTNESLSAPANERACERRAIADVNSYTFERRFAVADEHQVRRVENARLARAHPVGNCGRENRVLDWERFERDAANFRWRAFLNQMSIFDVALFQCAPCLQRDVHWTRRTIFQAPRVIGMCVREHDRIGIKLLKFSELIEAAIDHHLCAAIRDQQRAMHAMPPRA
jgi:hypothetical protein